MKMRGVWRNYWKENRSIENESKLFKMEGNYFKMQEINSKWKKKLKMQKLNESERKYWKSLKTKRNFT